MTFVITQGCCNDAVCVAVCPVQCIRPRPGDPDLTTTEQLYIDPATCVDCGACADVCPVEAIHVDYELPAHLDGYLQINAASRRTCGLSRASATPTRHIENNFARTLRMQVCCRQAESRGCTRPQIPYDDIRGIDQVA